VTAAAERRSSRFGRVLAFARFGPVYWDPRLYRLVMRFLDPDRKRRLALVLDEVEAGDLVVDLCCGDCALAEGVHARGARYQGLDLNQQFVHWARRRGVDARLWDANTDPIPEADVVCMQSSLYDFIPDEGQMLEQMRRSARRKVIVTEPVVNWATSGSPLLRRAARLLTRVDGRNFDARLDADAIAHLLDDIPPGEVNVVRTAREVVFVLQARFG
jgi:trans-aconitate methyltransferase